MTTTTDVAESPPAAGQQQSRPMIYLAMARCLADVKAVGKDGTNKEQGYRFRAQEDIAVAVRVALSKHELFYLPTVLTRIPETRQTAAGRPMNVVHLEIRYDFYAQDGSSVAATVWGEGADMADKSTNKAMTGALKYALIQAFNIAAEGVVEDSDRSAEQAGPSGGYRSAGAAFDNAAPADGNRRQRGRANGNGNGNGPRPAGDQTPAKRVDLTPLADDDPWKDRIADIATRDEGEKLYLEVTGLKNDGKIDEARAVLIRAHITAHVTNLGVTSRPGPDPVQTGEADPWQTDPPADQRPGPHGEAPTGHAERPRIRPEDQGAPKPSRQAAGDEDQAWLDDFDRRVREATTEEMLTALQGEVGGAVKFKKIQAATSGPLSQAIAARRKEIRGAAA